MKKMKKTILVIGLVIILGLTGCGSNTDSDINGNDGTHTPNDDMSDNVNDNSSDDVNDDSNNNSDENDATQVENNFYEAPIISEAQKAEFLNVINNARAVQQDCGSRGIKQAVPALAWNDALYRAAYEHSRDLALSNTFSHTGSGTVFDWTSEVLSLSGGSSVAQRMETNGYTNWRTYGENIAAGSYRDKAQIVIDAWLRSDGHCVNLMSPDFKEVGMGHFQDEESYYVNYWTQNFGA